MNYRSKNKVLLKYVQDMFNFQSNSGELLFSPVYNSNRKLSHVVICISNFQMYHALIMVYNGTVTDYYEIFQYRSKQFKNVGHLTKCLPEFEELNKYILKNIPKNDISATRNIKEGLDSVDREVSEIELQTLQDKIAGLEDKIELSKAQKESYRQKIKMLNRIIQLLRKRLKTEI